jgi:hypothetical protein
MVKLHMMDGEGVKWIRREMIRIDWFEVNCEDD